MSPDFLNEREEGAAVSLLKEMRDPKEGLELVDDDESGCSREVAHQNRARDELEEVCELEESACNREEAHEDDEEGDFGNAKSACR